MGWFPYLMNKTTFSKRLKQLVPQLEALFNRAIKQLIAVYNEFAVDSFPIQVAHKTRWARSTLAPTAEIGYCASKREYLLGFKASVIADSATRVVVDCWISPANVHDKKALEEHTVDLPENSILYADKAYNDKKMEAKFNNNGVHLAPIRRKNMKNDDNTIEIQQHKQKKENSLKLSLV